jgi:hypothetical protein
MSSAIPGPASRIVGRFCARAASDTERRRVDRTNRMRRGRIVQSDFLHSKVAIVTLASALKEPRYFAAATVSLQTALMLDALAHPEPSDIRQMQ